jgi:hypothetical protein
MRYQVKPAFHRILKSLPESRKSEVKEAISHLVQCLENREPPPGSLGLKLLRRPYWEIRSSLADRIFFAWTGDLIEWLYIGSHDDIQRLLKRYR